MKKIKFLCFYSLLFFSPAIFAETVVQPFADCKITLSKEGWQYDLKYSAGFPFHESKLFLILRYGNSVKRTEIPLQKTIAFDWKYSPGKLAFCSSHIKYEFPRAENENISRIFNLTSSKILFPGRKVVLKTWKTTSLADGKTLEQFCGELGLELEIPEHILQKYANAMSYEDLVMQNFLKKINVPDYWRYAKDFPSIPENSKLIYKTYPQMISAHIMTLDTYQRDFDAGKIVLQPILDLEILIMRRMLYAKNLPEAMRQKLVMEQYKRYKQILSLAEAAFAAGGEPKEFVDIAKSNLKLFVKKYNIKE